MLPLIDLIRAVAEPVEYPPQAATLSVTGLSVDSRKVEKGNLFFALKGVHADGSRFIEQAKTSGAVAVVCNMDTPAIEGITLLRVSNPRLAMAQIAARFYGSQPAHMVAVTGTDGKTSTADFYRQFWHHLGKASASVGTLGILSGSGETLYPGTHTTPDSIELHRLLADLKQKHFDYVGMEASSHGLHQHRLDGVQLQAAAFTNMARDHLDYHGTEEAYFAAKLRLFDTLLPEGKLAVLNQDDAHFPQVKAVCDKRKLKIIGFGKKGEQFRIDKLEPLPHGQKVSLTLLGKPYVLDVPLVGAFQVMNILAALGLVIGSGGELEQALKIIPKFAGVPGRLEQVAQLKNGATVFIDYAHTPMALANILNTLRPHTQKNLHVVFGCGGDRDAGKRPEMGRIACELADNVIVTDDNPRSEDPALIRKAIMVATKSGKAKDIKAKNIKDIADRREAIYVAMKGLNSGDILVIAGKGHEKIQITGTKITPFDDAEVARDALKELKLAA